MKRDEAGIDLTVGRQGGRCRASSGARMAAVAFLLAACGDSSAPGGAAVTRVTFPSVAVPGTSAATVVQLGGDLHLPASGTGQLAAVVILPTSAGIQPFREPYYARAFAESGLAALIVDSFGSRGIGSAVEDQGVLTSYQMEADAFGALAFLRGHERIRDDAIALMGASKGGTAALNGVFLIREVWRGTSARFAAHVAISPDCTTPHRSAGTTGAPLLIVLAEHDDYAAPAPCRDYATQIAATDGAQVTVHEVAGAAHGWERLGAIQFIPNAENFSACRGILEDDGRISVAGVPEPLTSAGYLAWARANCVTRGAHSGGGTTAMRDAATAAIRDFLVEALMPSTVSLQRSAGAPDPSLVTRQPSLVVPHRDRPGDP